MAAGITAGSWYASQRLMSALAAGARGLPLDYDELERWTRVGFEWHRVAGSVRLPA
jgi:hypothetical protein